VKSGGWTLASPPKYVPRLSSATTPPTTNWPCWLSFPIRPRLRGNRWELAIPKPFLKPGAFHLQQVQPIPLVRFDTRIGTLTPDEFKKVKEALVRLLNLQN